MRNPSTNVLLLVAALILPLGCKDDEPTNTGGSGGGGITSTAFPGNAANLAPGGAPAIGALTGGTAPYMITVAPNDSVATAVISGTNYDTLTITPVGVGTDSVIIEDSSPSSSDNPTAKTLKITITVSETGAGIQGSGIFTINTSLGDFSAEGPWVEEPTSGQGVGGVRSTNESEDFLQVWAYVVHSATNVDLVVAGYVASGGTLVPGSYPYLFTGGSMYSILTVSFGIDPANPTFDYYATEGTAMLNTINASSASGVCSGSGYNIQNPTQTFTFDSKSFTVTGYGTGSALEKSIQTAATRMLKKEIEARKKN